MPALRSRRNAPATFDPLTLRFRDRHLEQEFEHDYFEKSLRHVRMALGIAIALYSVFGFLDGWIVPEVEGPVWVIRYAIVDPVLLAALGFTFARRFESVMQPVLAGLYLVVSFGIIGMIVMAPPPGSHLYYAGLLLCVAWGFTVLRLHFVYAVGVSVLIGIAYEISAIWLGDTPLPILINNNFFFLSSNILGALAGYNIEAYIRRDFLQRRATEQSVEELKALGEIGRAVSSTLDLETVLTTIISRADQLAGTDGGAIYEYDERTERLRLRATRGLQDALVAELRASPIALGEGAVGRAAARRQIVQIADVVEDRGLARLRDLTLRYGFHAVLAIPLLGEDRILGGLVVVRQSPGAFPPTTIDLVTAFATQSALAIQNARLFREIELKSQQLEAASRHKSEFLANMSHELRTPLNAIIGFSEILLDPSLSVSAEDRQQFLSDVFSSGKHLLKLINEVLDLARIEAGRMELRIEPALLSDVLDAVQSTMRPLAVRKEIDLRVDSDGAISAFPMDAGRVKQVLLNLVGNAIKFTPEAGRVWVRVDVANGVARVEVGDTGPGIAAEDQERIFVAFQQVKPAGSGDKPEGTGLGLALAKKFVDMHGGQLWVESEVGQGSRFFFTLPMARRS